MNKWVELVGRQPKHLLMFIGIATVALLGLIDYRTGEELFFLEFYLIPVILVTWFLSEKVGILVCILSGMFWFVDDVFGRSQSGQPSIPFWNVGFKLIVFFLFVHLLTSLKTALEQKAYAEQELVHRELEIARQVQQRLLPQIMPEMKTLDYTGICIPMFEVGGDYYDFILLKSGMLAIALGDVSGKGISSALLMSNLQAIVRSRAHQLGNRVDVLVQEINSVLYSSTDLNKFATLFYCLYEDARRQLTYVNAGHNPPILFRKATSQVEPLNASGAVVGVIPDISYRKVTIQLCPGDVLVLYTDGITEACNDKAQEFGEKRLCEVIQQNSNVCSHQIAEKLLESVQAFIGHVPQHDDLTMVVMKIT